MGNYDFSRIRDMVELFGMPQDIAESMLRSFEQEDRTEERSENQVKTLEKDMTWSLNKFAKVTEEYDIALINSDFSSLYEYFLNNTQNPRKFIELHKNIKQVRDTDVINQVVECNDSEQIKTINKNIRRLVKDSIECVFDYEGKIPVSLGMSKFGGRPHVYQNFEWPYSDDTEPLIFLCQINCAEISKYDKDSLFPDEGILYFFYNFKGSRIHTDRSKNDYRVIYYSDSHSVFPREYPDDYNESCIYDEIALKYRLRESVPNFEEFNVFFNSDKDYVDEDEYFSIAKNYFPDIESEESVTKLLGYADCIQKENLSYCELEYRLRKNIKLNYSQFTKEQHIEFINSAKEWELLFQLDSILTEDMFLSFGDGERLYYYIRKKDLLNRDFSNCIICEKS